MTLDPLAIAHNAALLIGFMVVGWFICRFGRLLLGWATVMLFCVGSYPLAFVTFICFSMAVREHRRFIAQERACGFYNGPWID